jgi:hypothetical protein
MNRNEVTSPLGDVSRVRLLKSYLRVRCSLQGGCDGLWLRGYVGGSSNPLRYQGGRGDCKSHVALTVQPRSWVQYTRVRSRGSGYGAALWYFQQRPPNQAGSRGVG